MKTLVRVKSKANRISCKIWRKLTINTFKSYLAFGVLMSLALILKKNIKL